MPHTPGPWRMIEGDAKRKAMTDIVVSDRENYRIAFVMCEWANKQQREQDLADAKLIAAAPELLAALKSAMIWHGELTPCDEPDDGLRGLLLQMQAAIAKAEGGRP